MHAANPLQVLDAIKAGVWTNNLPAALSYSPNADLDEIARLAAAALEADPDNDVADELLVQLSLQSVHSLQPYLAQLWAFRDERAAYSMRFPWRGADAAEVKRLLDLLASEPLSETDSVLYYIAETRSPAHLAAARRVAPHALAREHLHLWGFEGERQLYFDAVYHLRFEPGFLPVPRQPHALHPTWQAGEVVGSAAFGGRSDATCNCCGQPLHRLLKLDSLPTGIAVSASQLDLVTCLSCLHWSEPALYFQHDAGGHPHAIGGNPRPPRFPAPPLLTSRVELVRTAPRWQWQDWTLSGGENLHRLGGSHTWVQDPQYPHCPGCNARMTALLQLDSDLPNDRAGWLWGGGGVGYVMWCDACRISATLLQCA